VTTCNRIIWRDISPEVPAHPQPWANVPRPVSSSKLMVPIPPPPDGYFLRLNPVRESTLGYTRDELKAKRFFDFVNPDDVAATQKATVTKMSRP
jgi:PAS domain-containing protein